MPSRAAMAPIAQHRGGDAQLACDLDQRPTAARQQGNRLPLELIRKMTPFLAHSTPFRSRRSLAKVSTNAGEAQCRESIRCALHRLGFSWKKARKLLGRADPVRRMEFIQDLRALRDGAQRDRYQLVYVDEAHIHQDVDPGYGWGVCGTPFHVASSSPGL